MGWCEFASLFVIIISMLLLETGVVMCDMCTSSHEHIVMVTDDKYVAQWIEGIATIYCMPVCSQ